MTTDFWLGVGLGFVIAWALAAAAIFITARASEGGEQS